MQPAAGSSGKVIWLVAVELGTASQLVAKPTAAD